MIGNSWKLFSGESGEAFFEKIPEFHLLFIICPYTMVEIILRRCGGWREY